MATARQCDGVFAGDSSQAAFHRNGHRNGRRNGEYDYDAPMIKGLVLVLLAAIVVSLFSGLFFLKQDQGNSHRLLNALTIRIGLSVLLFVLLMVAWRMGAIQPHGLLPR